MCTKPLYHNLCNYSLEKVSMVIAVKSESNANAFLQSFV